MKPRIYSTCPQSKDFAGEAYLDQVVEVARWSENAGMHGILVYTDNSLADPWLVSHLIVGATKRLVPLVAVQPIYMHPYGVAKMIASTAYLYGRKVDVNLLAGGFRNDLLALGDPTPHDDRYVRTAEYGSVVRRLCDGGPVTFEGAYYTVKNLVLRPELPPELRPGFLISGSSAAGVQAAHEVQATAVRYPAPPGEEESVLDAGIEHGVRVGLIVRPSEDEAWDVAADRFPEDRKGQIAHQLAMKVSDSHWHQQLAMRDGGTGAGRDPYWLEPFRNQQTFCPYLVGSYERVAVELRAYIDRGFATFILDIPPSEEELRHTTIAFDRALDMSPR